MKFSNMFLPILFRYENFLARSTFYIFLFIMNLTFVLFKKCFEWKPKSVLTEIVRFSNEVLTQLLRSYCEKKPNFLAMKCRKNVNIIWLVIPKLSKQICRPKNWSKHIRLKKETKILAKKCVLWKMILNLKPLRMFCFWM